MMNKKERGVNGLRKRNEEGRVVFINLSITIYVIIIYVNYLWKYQCCRFELFFNQCFTYIDSQDLSSMVPPDFLPVIDY